MSITYAGRDARPAEADGDPIDTVLDEAACSKMTLREGRGFPVSREIAGRDERRISMTSRLAQFPLAPELEGFDFDAAIGGSSAD
ncbi:hypothetical protein [Sinorhizobium meliloti]|uniref:hypothetical protein n=1 Tax=Rhizobium meliloti TaxID=382 RepID=UPI002354EB29|nr:hypothetical protein [Sinorhizobium meliloti]